MGYFVNTLLVEEQEESLLHMFIPFLHLYSLNSGQGVPLLLYNKLLLSHTS